MCESQHYTYDLQENHGGVDSTDTQLWPSGNDHPPSTPSVLQRTLSSVSSAAGGNVDPVLYNDLIQMVPLIQNLIDKKPKSSFTRRGSMIYTKAPSKELNARKTIESKGRNGAQSKRLKDGNPDGNSEFSMFSSASLSMDKNRDELASLREQMEDLQRKISEKDELLKSAEVLKTEMIALQEKLDDMKTLVAEKDVLLKSTQRQLSQVKVDLADKRAESEKLQWEAMTSNQRVEKLQKDLEMVEEDVSSIMVSFEELSLNRPASDAVDIDFNHDLSDQFSEPDDEDDISIGLIEEAREAYVAAIAAAKENRDEESIAAAAIARLNLQSLVLTTF